MNVLGYDVNIERLAPHLGGGFVAYVPALKGCVADGETEEAALGNIADAILCWIDAARQEAAKPHTASKPRPHFIH